MKLLIDVNLSPTWQDYLHQHGIEAVHWSNVGDARARDIELVRWAREAEHVVFTHDLDFSRILALTHATGASVVLVRTEDVLPEAVGGLIVRALHQHREVLEAGAVLVVDATSSRARVLPI